MRRAATEFSQVPSMPDGRAMVPADRPDTRGNNCDDWVYQLDEAVVAGVDGALLHVGLIAQKNSLLSRDERLAQSSRPRKEIHDVRS